MGRKDDHERNMTPPLTALPSSFSSPPPLRPRWPSRSPNSGPPSQVTNRARMRNTS